MGGVNLEEMKAGERMDLINKNNRLEEELNQTKLLLDGKNTQYEGKKKECENLVSSMWNMSQEILALKGEKANMLKKFEEIKHYAKSYSPVGCRSIIDKCNEVLK